MINVPVYLGKSYNNPVGRANMDDETIIFEVKIPEIIKQLTLLVDTDQIIGLTIDVAYKHRERIVNGSQVAKG